MEYEYINSGIDWLGDIPSHWKIDRIKDKAINVVGGDWGNDPESNSKGEKLVVLRVSDLNGIYFSYDNLTYRKIKKSSVKNRLVNHNSLLIEKSGGGEKQIVGRVGYPKGIDFSAICSNFMAKIEFNKAVNLSFMNYYFNFLYDRNVNFQFVQQTTGIQNLNVGYYLTTKVAFPPLPEQIAIAAYLDQACARIDRIIQIKERQLEKIFTYHYSLCFEILTKGIEDYECIDSPNLLFEKVPVNWEVKKLRYLLKLKNGKLIKNTELKKDGIFPVYGGNGITGYADKWNYEGNLIIIGRVGAKCGNVHITNEKVWVSDNAIAVRSNLDYRFSYHLLSYLNLNRLASETAQPLLVGNNIKKLYVGIPSKEEQKKIVQKIETSEAKIMEIQSKLKAQINTLKNYRKSLIHECVTGKKQVYKPKEQQMQKA